LQFGVYLCGAVTAIQQKLMESAPNLRPLVRTALFTALTIVGAYISLPIGEVPIVLSDFVVMLAGLLLGRGWAPLSVGIYLLLGAVGLPVFAGGAGGIQAFYGPTGGYLFGFLVSSWLVSSIAQGKTQWYWHLAALVAGSAVIFTLGVAWLQYKLGLTLAQALAAGFLPFIPFNVVKMLVATALARQLQPLIYPTSSARL